MCNSYGMPNTTTPQMIGSALAAEMLNVDRSTLTRWVKSNKLTPALTGTGKTGEMFFYLKDVEALIKSPTTAALADSNETAGARGGDAA